jgi:hypothetical protein
MHRLLAALSFVLFVSPVLVAPGCCCPSGLEEANDCTWILTCVELDKSLVCNAGTLPIYRRTDGYSFGREPVALGTMQGSREGLWSVNVTFKEPVVAFSGRSGVHQYDVLQLAGKVQKSGDKICAQGAFPSNVAMGVATEVNIDRISQTKMKIQPATRGKRLPYIFTFDSTPPQPRAVSIPLL